MLRALRDDDRGQGLAEYGVILGFVAVLCVVAVIFTGSQLLAHYQSIAANYP